VHNTGSPPELFQPAIPVIAVGHFSGSTFVSNQILVKHTSDYIAAHPGRVTAANGTKR
jgi:cytochrome c-type biogenesis protein CcmE